MLVNYGFSSETDGLKRSSTAKMDDCKDFLHMLATFLPHGYLTEKLVTTTTSFENAFEIILEHYGLLPSQESFLNLMSLNKETGESYRQFFERMMAHVRQHLQTQAGVNVDGATVPRGGDKISVSHANLVALIWLQKIHPEMVNIVRTENSLELRENKPIAGLIPRISVNVDNLLSKYDKVGSVNYIQSGTDSCRQPTDTMVARTFIKKQNKKEKDMKSLFCPGCYNLTKRNNAQVHCKHLPLECPRKALIHLEQTCRKVAVEAFRPS